VGRHVESKQPFISAIKTGGTDLHPVAFCYHGIQSSQPPQHPHFRRAPTLSITFKARRLSENTSFYRTLKSTSKPSPPPCHPSIIRFLLLLVLPILIIEIYQPAHNTTLNLHSTTQSCLPTNDNSTHHDNRT
jgi:hypothetical protein